MGKTIAAKHISVIATLGLLKKPDPLRGSWFQRLKPDKLALILAIDDCHNCRALQMYRRHHNG
jgi:hypothetical protein